MSDYYPNPRIRELIRQQTGTCIPDLDNIEYVPMGSERMALIPATVAATKALVFSIEVGPDSISNDKPFLLKKEDQHAVVTNLSNIMKSCSFSFNYVMYLALCHVDSDGVFGERYRQLHSLTRGKSGDSYVVFVQVKPLEQENMHYVVDTLVHVLEAKRYHLFSITLGMTFAGTMHRETLMPELHRVYGNVRHDPHGCGMETLTVGHEGMGPRISIYNLFAKTLFGSSHAWIGNKIEQYLKGKDPTLYLDSCLKYGATQIDVTLYSRKYILPGEAMNEFYEHLGEKPFFYAVPLTVQWRQIVDKMLGCLNLYVILDDFTQLSRTLHTYTAYGHSSCSDRTFGKYRLYRGQSKLWERLIEHTNAATSLAGMPCHSWIVHMTPETLTITSKEVLYKPRGLPTLASNNGNLYPFVTNPIDLDKTFFADSNIKFTLLTRHRDLTHTPVYKMLTKEEGQEGKRQNEPYIGTLAWIGVRPILPLSQLFSYAKALKMVGMSPFTRLRVVEVCRFLYHNSTYFKEPRKYLFRCDDSTGPVFLANIELGKKFHKINWATVRMPLTIRCGEYRHSREAGRKQIEILEIQDPYGSL